MNKRKVDLETVDALINTANVTGLINYLDGNKQDQLLDLLLEIRQGVLFGGTNLKWV